jgi:hypothetical protein
MSQALLNAWQALAMVDVLQVKGHSSSLCAIRRRMMRQPKPDMLAPRTKRLRTTGLAAAFSLCRLLSSGKRRRESAPLVALWRASPTGAFGAAGPRSASPFHEPTLYEPVWHSAIRSPTRDDHAMPIAVAFRYRYRCLTSRDPTL